MRGNNRFVGGMGALALVALVLTSCTGSAEEGPSEPTTGTAARTAAPPGQTGDVAAPTETPEAPPPPEPAWTFEGTILSTPVAHDGDLLLHVDPEGEEVMALVSLDAATGEENWRRPVGHSGIFSVDPPSVRDDLVYAYEDTGRDEQAFVVALDAATGEEVARSEQELRGYEMPDACGESEVCLAYRLPGAREFTFGHLRLEGDVLQVVEGRPLESGDDADPAGPAEVSGEEPEEDVEDLPVVDVERDWETGEERIEGWRGDEVVWSVSVDEAGLRPGPDDAGVLGLSQRIGEVYLHDVFYGTQPASDEAADLPLEGHVLLALDREDGSELWRREGASRCAVVGPSAQVVPTCSGDGAVRSNGFDETTVVARDVVLRGLAVDDGEVLWSHEITDEDWTAQHGDLPIALDEEQSLLVVDGERVVVDLATGELTPAADARVVGGFACWWAVPWDAPTNLEDGSERMTGRFDFPCDAQGEQVPIPTEKGIDTFAQTSAGARLVVGPDLVAAYPD